MHKFFHNFFVPHAQSQTAVYMCINEYVFYVCVFACVNYILIIYIHIFIYIKYAHINTYGIWRVVYRVSGSGHHPEFPSL